MIEYLKTNEIKDVYKNLILPILNGETVGIYPTDNSYTKWANLADNIEVFNRSATNLRLEHGLMVAKRVDDVIQELISSNLLKI